MGQPTEPVVKREFESSKPKDEEKIPRLQEALPFPDKAEDVLAWASAFLDRTSQLTKEEGKKNTALEKEATELRGQLATKTTENQILTAESLRLTAENQRLTNESQRLTSESQRLAGENQRLTNESQQFTSEKQRLTNEIQQLKIEAERLKTENTKLQQDISKSADKVVCAAAWWNSITYVFFIDKTRKLRYWQVQPDSSAFVLDLLLDGKPVYPAGNTLAATNIDHRLRLYYTDENRNVAELCLDRQDDRCWQRGNYVGTTSPSTVLAVLGSPAMCGSRDLIKVIFNDVNEPNTIHYARHQNGWIQEKIRNTYNTPWN